MTHFLKSDDPKFDEKFNALISVNRNEDDDLRKTVSKIIDDVRSEGFAAVAKYTSQFDGMAVTENTLKISADEIRTAQKIVSPKVVEALKVARDRIFSYHEKQMPDDLSYKDAAGVMLGWRWTAIASAGLYVPGGRAAYPSSVLMNAVPAKVVGVERLIMVTPTPNGEIDPAVLVAAQLAGVDEIYRVGGAQAIAALAYGAGTISAVDVIVGPGNAYVAEAKRQLFGTVGIDSVAGPSEILVVADGQNNPSWIAADLLSQAEHDPSSQSILVTDDEIFASKVSEELKIQSAQSPRQKIVDASWKNNGAIIIVQDIEQAAPLVDRIAPEHLELAVKNPDDLLGKIRNAGAIFMGRYTPEAVGDYIAGPNHVLPTGGGARFASGLSVFDFIKRSSLIGCDMAALQAIGPSAACLADQEGLPAHAHSIRVRLDKPQ